MQKQPPVERVGKVCRAMWCGAPPGGDDADDYDSGEDEEGKGFLSSTPMFATEHSQRGPPGVGGGGGGGGAQSSASASTECDVLNYLVLITDGSVEDEREIVADLKPSGVRVLAFGVGTFCNGYFLRTLANESRGSFAHALESSKIAAKLEELLQQTSRPLLRDVQLGLPACLRDAELLPTTIPDVTAKQDVLVRGYVDSSTEEDLTELRTAGAIHCRGWNALGHLEVFSVQLEEVDETEIPLRKVFVRDDIDAMISRSWFMGSTPTGLRARE